MKKSDTSAVTRNLQQLLQMGLRVAKQDGFNQTSVPFFEIFRSSSPVKMIPIILEPSFCVILQGTKKILLEKNILEHRAGDCLAAIIDAPASGQIIGASKAAPYIGLKIAFSVEDITSVVSEAKISFATSTTAKVTTGAFIGKADQKLLALFAKLLLLPENKDDAIFLANLIKKEMIFRLLKSQHGHLLYQRFLFDRQSDGIGKVISWIKDNYFEPLSIENLAKENHMSISSLHHKFKAITMMAPLQYQKELRLQEARRLLLNESLDVTTAAMDVGYGSLSQFHREYRKRFGATPFKDMKSVVKEQGRRSKII